MTNPSSANPRPVCNDDLAAENVLLVFCFAAFIHSPFTGFCSFCRFWLPAFGVTGLGFRVPVQNPTRNTQLALFFLFTIHDSLLLCFLPFLVAVSIASSGYRFWLPFCRAKSSCLQFCRIVAEWPEFSN
jgi:hypothetical protein